jgi:anion-transporting  ArsA/GET3 family ATPase
MASDFTSLLKRQVLLVTGKGGVGKSTVAAAFALVAARTGNRTLFVELDRDTSLDGLFSLGGIGHTPRRIHDKLWACKVDPGETLNDFLREIVPGGPLMRMAVSNKIMTRFWRATPSAYEMMSLVEMHKQAELKDKKGQRRWDNLVVDLPSTGHALTLLGVPRTATLMFKVGPVNERAAKVRDLLSNRLRCAMVWVTLPEEMPINETEEFFPRFREKLDVALDHVIVNGVYPEVLEPDEHRTYDDLRSAVEPATRELYNLVNCVEGLVIRGTHNREQIDRLEGSIDARILEIPMTRVRGPELIGMVADSIESASRDADRRPA